MVDLELVRISSENKQKIIDLKDHPKESINDVISKILKQIYLINNS